MMSNILHKTFNVAVASLKSKQLETFDLQALMQALSSFQNESTTICRFLQQIRINFDNASASQQRQYLILIIYCTQVGLDSSVVKQSLSDMGAVVSTFIAKSVNITDKRLGYLTLTAIIDCGASDIVYLAVNTVLKDISSKHPTFIKLALDVTCHLVCSVDLVPVFLTVIEHRLSHSDGQVRIRAIRSLHCMYKVAPEYIQNTKNHVKGFLCDRDPEVMAASLVYIYDIIKKDPSTYDDIPPKFLLILKQIVQGNLPVHMSRHGIAAPFLQIHILKILLLFKLNQDVRASLAEALHDMMNRCQSSKHTIAFAVLSECIQTIVAVFRCDEVIFNLGVQYLGLFLHSQNPNLVLTGLELLSKVAKIEPSCCFQYQSTVVKCLEHYDTTVKKQTLLLLQTLITKENHEALCNHMIRQLKTFNEDYFVKTLSEKIATNVEEFSPSFSKQTKILHSVIESCGENVSSTVCDKLIDCVSKGSSDELVEELQYCQALLSGTMSYHHFRAILNILSRHSKEGSKSDEIVQLILKQSQVQFHKKAHEDVAYILTCTVKEMLCQGCVISEEVLKNVFDAAAFSIYHSPAVRQNLIELEVISKNDEIKTILGSYNSELDDDFSFLDEYVDKSEPLKESLEVTTMKPEPKTELKSRPYQVVKQSAVKSTSAFMASLMPQHAPTAMGESFLSKDVPTEQSNPWGKSGYVGKETANVSLDEALENLSSVGNTCDEDRAMLDLVNNVFLSTQASSSDDTLPPYTSFLNLNDKS